ncbi:MAG: hypothetical protein TREMPRED_003183, partial [Tremellales sp. Tagirdzhanova-0007]
FGALLGNQTNREVSIVNSFELILENINESEDVTMSESSETRKITLDVEFLLTRREQFRQVFPTLDVIGWYSIGETPSAEDVSLHEQFAISLDTPIFLLFNPTPSPGSQNLPLKVYEAILVEGGEKTEVKAKFVELEYEIETGEAERIAVDGISRGAMEGGAEDNPIVGNLRTQRNAIRMLRERIGVLLQYVTAVVDRKSPINHDILRQISALLAMLPTMDAKEFREELSTEHGDVQLSNCLASLTKQLNALSEYADKHNVLYPAYSEDGGRQRARGGGRGFYGIDLGGSRRRKY